MQALSPQDYFALTRAPGTLVTDPGALAVVRALEGRGLLAPDGVHPETGYQVISITPLGKLACRCYEALRACG